MARPTRMASSTIRNAARSIPTGTDPAAVRRRVDGMHQLLERSFKIPGTNQHVGLDALIGLIPVGGDLIGAMLGFYMVWEARNLKMSRMAMSRMVGNVALDFLLGLVPGVGDAADFFFRSNTRNVRIIRKHLDRHYPSTATVGQ
ncbi:DUF4112 domain-containing protein [Sphingosinithalassobacter sp. CS137]|uniref:DUF4112 domain-containing protein n=1 Tax=Sphingosinithalassobacter sp. CS137 TaxID=2762748 RepID=UPI00165D522B|nr:DUF4112 domain-containing protein [Sphingosinithalassobacter sp. CS137]